MNPHEFRSALHTGGPVFGTLIVSESPRWSQAVAGSGLDFVFIDTEHVALDSNQIAWMCQTYERLGMAPLVRIPSPDPFQAVRMLDVGAAGIIAPYVESAEQVKKLRGAVRYRPLKGQRLENVLDGQAIEPELDSYLAERNNGHSLIVNIESVPGIAALDEILAVEGLDGVLIGPHDLSCSLGVPEQYDHPDFLAAVQTIFTKARAKNVGAGIHYWGKLAEEVAFLNMGANMLIHSGDIMLFAKHLRQDLQALRKAVGMDGDSADQDISI